MSKYIIEIEDKAVGGLFKAKGFNALVFDKNGLDKLQKYEESVEETIKKPSFPQLGDKYFCISSICINSNGCADVESYLYSNDNIDASRMEIGNFFRTREEAEFARERLKVLAEMRKFAEPLVTKWDGDKVHNYIYCGVSNESLRVGGVNSMRGGELYFESEERANDCIRTVGEDRIKKYYLGVE